MSNRVKEYAVKTVKILDPWCTGSLHVKQNVLYNHSVVAMCGAPYCNLVYGL